MDLTNIIQSRRTIHDYNGETVDEETVLRALELSLFAPNHKLTFPWRYYSLKGKIRHQVEDGMIEFKSINSEESFSSVKKSAMKKKLSAASHLIILAKKKNDIRVLSEEDYATVACSVQIISMYLWEQGIGVKWSSGAYAKSEDVAKACGINPSQEDMLGILWIGYPQRVPELKPRPGISEVLTEIG